MDSLVNETAVSTDINAELFTIEHEKSSNEYIMNNMWYAIREWFSTFTVFGEDECKVKVADGTLVSARGIGDVNVEVKNKNGTVNAQTISNI